jgi:hypothetical protein
MSVPFKTSPVEFNQHLLFPSNIFDLLAEDHECYLYTDLFQQLDTSAVGNRSALPMLPIIIALCLQVLDRMCKRQQFVDTAIRPSRQFFQGISKPRGRVESIQFCCAQQRLDGSSPLTSPLRTGK